jgi:fatty acid amide hydrolase
MIPFTKSNVPQLAMIYDCYNYLWSRGLNPWNQLRSIGGSSGGEGGLVAARCSPVGIGSDVGGSIRIPAEFCGVYGLKPSDFRLSNNYSTEFTPTFQGMDTLHVVIGPLSNSVEGLALWMKTVTNE